MTKKGKKGKEQAQPKQNDEPVQNQNQPAGKKQKRTFVIREEHPNVVVPIVATVLIFALLGLGDKFGLLDRVLSLYIGGGVAIAFLVLTSIYYVKFYLYPEGIRPVIIGTAILTLLCCGGLIYYGSWSSPPLEKGTLSRTSPAASVNLPSGQYKILFQGDFIKENTETEKGKAKSTTIMADYAVSLSSPTDLEFSKAFKGQFEYLHQRRKMARRSRGYQEVRLTTGTYSMRIPTQGEYQLNLGEMSTDLEDVINFSVYKSSFLPYILVITGILAMILAGFVDYVIKAGRVASIIGPAVGAAYGFAAYFYFESTPIFRFSSMAMDLLVGGFTGALIAVGIYYGLQSYYEQISKSKHIAL